MSASSRTRPLDHVALYARNLDDAQRRFERLGFRLTERGFHSGATKPGGAIEPWGQANHCAPFRRGYLELIGLFNEARFAPAKALLERYEGVHLAAFATNDASATAVEFSERFQTGIEPQALERPVKMGVDGAERMIARFANVYPPASSFPEGRVFAIEHLTPEAIWQPYLMDHPNGVVALFGIDIIVADPSQSVSRFGAMMDGPVRKDGASTILGDEALGEVRLHPLSASPDWLGTMPIAEPPWIGGIRFAVASIDATAGFFAKAGIAAEADENGAVVVPHPEAHGAALRFHTLPGHMTPAMGA